MIQFTLTDAQRILSKTPGVLRQWLSDLPENWQHANEGKDTFSPFDVLGHLIHGEQTDWIPRMNTILQFGESRPFDPYDRFAQYDLSKGKTMTQLLDEFETERNRCLQVLREANLTDAQLDSRGLHPRLGSVTLRQLLATWVAHDQGHIAQIARVMAKQYKTEVGPWTRFMNVLYDRSVPGDADHNWSRFSLRIPVSQPASVIFPWLSTRAGIENWFLREAIFKTQDEVERAATESIAPGDQYAWRWHGWPDETQEHGVILENNGKDTVSFTFAGNCTVTISLKETGALTVVELTQENIPTDESSRVRYYHGCSTGWLFYLTNMKSLLEGGLDLRNRDEKLQGVLNA